MKVCISDGFITSLSNHSIAKKISSSLVLNHVETEKKFNNLEVVIRYLLPGSGLGSVYKRTFPNMDAYADICEFIEETLENKSCVIHRGSYYIGGYTISDPTTVGRSVIDILLYDDVLDDSTKLYRF